MFKRILVPLDGSAYAERALPIAKHLAQASQGAVVLLRVVDPLTAPQRAMSPSFSEAEFTEASRYVTSLVHTEEPDNVSMETMVLGGPAASLILSGACLAHTDLMVLCRHGYADARRYSIGSVAEKVIWQSALPVLVLGEADPLSGMLTSGDTQPMCILVPLDGSAHAKAALLPAAQLIAALSYPARGAMHLLHIVPAYKENAYHTEEQRVSLQRARTYLQTVSKALHEGLMAPSISELQLTITWSVATDNDIASTIIQIGEEREKAEEEGERDTYTPCEVIAMATHGWGSSRRWAMGCMTERVLQATRRPLLIVRPSWLPSRGGNGRAE